MANTTGQKRMPAEVSMPEGKNSPPPEPQRKANPAITAAAGALFGSGMGFGPVGMIVGAVIGALLAKGSQIEQKKREEQND